MNAVTLLSELRRLNPGVRFARYHNDSAVGEWIPSVGRFAPVYERAGEKWVCIIENGMIRETLVNGKSVYEPAKWVE